MVNQCEIADIMRAPEGQKLQAQVNAFINTAVLPAGFEDIRTRELRAVGLLDADSETLIRMHSVFLEFQRSKRKNG